MDRKWSNNKRPDVEDLLTIMEHDNQLAICVVGHLILESLLVQLIDIRLSNPAAFDTFRLPFPQKADLALSLGLIDEPLADLLKTLNTLRNRFAHRLGHEISFEEAYQLAVDAGKVGADFSDGVDSDMAFAQAYYSAEMLLAAVFRNTADMMAWILEENGGEYCFV